MNVPVVTDLGSGALVDLSQYGLPKEPTVQEKSRPRCRFGLFLWR